ncbi:Metallo-dependent phosphatase [Pyrenochaeta sp. DS3sAY3a]|nr:Metallo-dependent phosphatase [Pyrenochaeta sp. DS3sAY3a]
MSRFLTVIMKMMQLLWLLGTTVHAADPRLLAQRGPVYYPGVQFDGNGKFSISVFSDLHFGETEGYGGRYDMDTKTVNVMYSILDSERPNFVVLNGDLISCERMAPGNVNGLLDRIMGPLVNRNMPFAATFGNHDASTTCSTRSMSEHMWDIKGTNGKKLSFTTSSVPGGHDQVGTSNYFVPVYSSTDSTRLAMILWFFDSKGGKAFQPGGNDVPLANWVDEKVVSWFRQTNNELRQMAGRVVPSLAFVHIPVQAARSFQTNKDRATLLGLDREAVGHQGTVCGNTCNYNGADIPFMTALVETEGLMSVFSGHDHGVDWCMKWSQDLPNTSPANGKGLNICFNRHSGYGGYSDWTRGARQIVVQEDKLSRNELETYIKLENGQYSGRVTLKYAQADQANTTGL